MSKGQNLLQQSRILSRLLSRFRPAWHGSRHCCLLSKHSIPTDMSLQARAYCPSCQLAYRLSSVPSLTKRQKYVQRFSSCIVFIILCHRRLRYRPTHHSRVMAYLRVYADARDGFCFHIVASTFPSFSTEASTQGSILASVMFSSSLYIVTLYLYE